MPQKYHVSILDSDLYKFSMQMAICLLFPKVNARYSFINRDGRQFPKDFGENLRRIINDFTKVRLTPVEKEYLINNCPYFSPFYIDFLSGYQYDPSEVIIDQKGTDLIVTVEGPWYRTVLWEVPLMATISELYFEKTGQRPLPRCDRRSKNIEKAQEFKEMGISLIEFGTRRRYSFENQDEVITDLSEVMELKGTSNVFLAIKHGLTPLGTQAHEWISGIATFSGIQCANIAAMDNWLKVYNGNLGTVLTDTFGTTAFFQVFNGYYARIFDALRHDSGDPIIFAKRVINHYNMLRINPLFKSIIFSDSLDIDKIKRIQSFCQYKINTLYGVGTYLTNDVGLKALNIVIKLINVDDNHAIKLSDAETKAVGDPTTVKLAKQQLKQLRYYVYALLDPRKTGVFRYKDLQFKAEPFYVGKGQGNRINHHVYQRDRYKSHKSNKIKKIIGADKSVITIKIAENLTEMEALKLESDIIASIGLKKDGGPLTNVHPDSLATYNYTPKSIEQKDLHSQIMKGRFKGRVLTPKWKEKIKDNNAKYWKGKHLSEETKQKLRDSVKKQDFSFHCNIYEAESPEGKKFIINNGMKNFCIEHNLHRPKMISLSTGKIKYYKGWKCRVIKYWQDKT